MDIDEPRGGGNYAPEPRDVARDGHPGWRTTLYVMWVAQLLAILGFSFVMPFMPFYVRELGVQGERAVAVWSGWVITAGGASMALISPFWGWMADRYGRKAMVARSMLGGMVVMSLMGLAQNVYQLVALRAGQGLLTGTMSASVALVSSIVPISETAFSLGLMQTAVYTGNCLGPSLGGLAADHWGYRIPFAITGAVLLVGGLLVVFGAREHFVRPAKREAPGTAVPMWRLPGALSLLCIFTLFHFSGSFVGPIFPLYVERLLGRPEGAATATGILGAVGGITGAVGAVVVGRMSDRLGHKRVLVACTGLAALFCFPQAVARSVPELLAVRVLFGIAAGGMIPAMNALVAAITPRERIGRAYGLVASFSSVGWATGPAVGGWAAGMLGLHWPFAIMGILLLAVTLAVKVAVPKV